MAAIRKRIPPPLTPPPHKTLVGPKHNQPPPFRATGRGYFNRLPDFPATERIANGLLKNKATAVTHPLHKIYLFVDAVETGWQLTGKTTQAQTSRNFYPMNMAQDDLVIYGSVANQYEYDRLVEFVLHHHLSQFNPSSQQATTLDGDAAYYACQFQLFRPTSGGTNFSPPMNYGCVITDISAGHERFKNYPTWQMTCKVTFDHLDQGTITSRQLDYWTTFKDVYGDALPPVMSTGKDASSQDKKKKQQTTQTSNTNPTHPGANA